MISTIFMAFLFLVLLSLFASPAKADPLYSICGSTGNFTSNSIYSSNLNILLGNLSSNAPATGFATYTTGSIPNHISGLTLCRGDTDITSCGTCISTAISDIQQLCLNCKDATIWYDNCLLRYSNQDFLYSARDFTSNINNVIMYNTQNVSADQILQFEPITPFLVGKISHLAVKNISRLFATGETVLTVGNTIYGLVQCARDLPASDCWTCLQDKVNQISESFLIGQKGVRVLGLWCNLRYEIYKFYNGTSMLQLTSAPPPASPSPTNGSSTASHGGKKRITIFLPLGVFLILSTIVCLIWLKKRRVKETSNSQKDQTPIIQGTEEFSLISFSSIVEATGNFAAANKLGQGGFGSVYKGQLTEGESIAVKRLDARSGQGLEQFMNEIRLIAKLQHQNLVKLLGYCVEGDEKLLIYEYMPNNSLDYHLFDPVRKEQLDWSKRFAIIEGITQGLLYLHKFSRVRIIHRDLKASNILLDLDMNPKISDFGMARIFDANTTQANTNRIVGTYGYMSPEYAMEGIFSIKSDVFSFGVLMLEIISGKRNTIFHKSGKALNLLAYAWELWKSGNLLDFVDPSLHDKIFINEMSSRGAGGEQPSRRSFLQFRRSKQTTTGPTSRRSDQAGDSTPTPSPHSPVVTTPPPPPETQTPTLTQMEAAADSRIMITLEGDIFHPSKYVTPRTEIIKSMFDGPYFSWRKVPHQVPEIWFTEFKKYFIWLLEDTDKVRRNFRTRCSNRLRDMFTDIRKTGEKLVWIGDDVWQQLLAEWAKREYVQMRKKNKQNRASGLEGVGTSLHTWGGGGSFLILSIGGGCLGRELTMAELHQCTHQRQSNKELVDQKSSTVHSEYIHLREQSQASKGQASQTSDFDTWRETAGGKKKGRIYGLGSVGHGASTSSHSSHSVDSSGSTIETLIRRAADPIERRYE